MAKAIAVAASREQVVGREERWYYSVQVIGARGGQYEVALVERPGEAPFPFKTERAGRKLRTSAARAEIEAAAQAALCRESAL